MESQPVTASLSRSTIFLVTTRMDLCFELATQILAKIGSAVTVADETRQSDDEVLPGFGLRQQAGQDLQSGRHALPIRFMAQAESNRVWGWLGADRKSGSGLDFDATAFCRCPECIGPPGLG